MGSVGQVDAARRAVQLRDNADEVVVGGRAKILSKYRAGIDDN